MREFGQPHNLIMRRTLNASAGHVALIKAGEHSHRNHLASVSRCGLGMTSPNPVLSSLQNFPLVYSALVKSSPDRIRATFDVQSAIDGARKLAKRRSYIFDRDFTK